MGRHLPRVLKILLRPRDIYEHFKIIIDKNCEFKFTINGFMLIFDKCYKKNNLPTYRKIVGSTVK